MTIRDKSNNVLREPFPFEKRALRLQSIYTPDAKKQKILFSNTPQQTPKH